MIRTMFARRLLTSSSILSCAVLLSFVVTHDVSGDELKLPVAEGPFHPTPESLEKYQYPDWYRDAKFGIWAHWGPQSVPMDGDWYARGMYEPGNKHYQYHLEHYGHPSEFGYKDIIPLWKAEKWDPDRLMNLYKRAGAKYFVSMGSHHDNFFLWNSKLHRWNAVNMGPHRDVVGDWQKAAQKYGLKFGVSEHLGASFTWFQSSHRADKEGPKAGVPYDGANPEYEDLYHFTAEPNDRGWYSTNPRWQQQWYNEIKELVDNYHPDLLYTDGGVPFGNAVGYSMIAHLYNDSASRNQGLAQVIYTCKEKSGGRWVEDLERGIMPQIDPHPWQTDTSIGDWFYNRNWKFRPVSWVIHLLVDNVSKNGNLLLNVVQRPDGSLDPEVEQMLEQLAEWNAIHGEAIFGTRPWLVYGEGTVRPSTLRFAEDYQFNAREIRFTTKGPTLYAFALGWPEDRKVTIRSLAKPAGSDVNRIEAISLLGYDGKVDWQQTADGLTVTLPEKKVSEFTAALKITGSNLTNVTDAKSADAKPVTVASPDGKIGIEIKTDAGGQLTWSVQRQGQTILAAAPLGLTVDGHDLGKSVKLGEPRNRTIDERYPTWGNHSTAVNRCNEAIIPVECADGMKYELEVRAFEDGAAVRTRVPLDDTAHTIAGEATAWALSPDARAWWARYDSGYERPCESGSLESIPARTALAPPSTFKVGENLYVALTEANNDSFPDMGLERNENFLKAVFPASSKGWTHQGTIVTPWRVAIIAEGLNALVNTDIVTNLCPPPSAELASADWIKPGRSLWQWWAIGAPKLNDQKQWVDAAKQLGFEYYLIDEGWRSWRAPDKDQWQCLQEVIDYAKTQGVASLVWVNSSEMRTDAARRTYLERVKAVGAVGIKIDFIPACTAEITRWYEGALRDTADLHLMCNFHGAVKPTGRRRTWPHELTREAVRGHEYHMTRYRRIQAADHDETVLFTRFLAGPADYTPTAFDSREMVGYTWAHLLAQAVNMTSPLLHFAGGYQDFIGNPSEDLLRHLPSTWDETIVLPGSEIGKTIAFARRRGQEWYIGALNGKDESTFSIDFAFLGEGKWQAEIFGDDAASPAAFKQSTQPVTSKDRLNVSMSQRGGNVVWIRRAIPDGEVVVPRTRSDEGRSGRVPPNTAFMSLGCGILINFFHERGSTMKKQIANFCYASMSTLLLAGLFLYNSAAVAEDEFCGTCGPQVSVSGNFTHRKDNARVNIEGAGDNAVAYREDINGQDFTVNIATLPAGKYTITIGVAETTAAAAGERVFTVMAGDTTLAKDFDIFAKAGGARKLTTISGSVEHEDDSLRGPLKITFASSKGAAKFNTIDVKNAEGATAVSFSASELADAFSAASARVPHVADAPIWRNPAKPLDARIDDLIRRMSLAEKVAQLKNAAPAIARLGLPSYDYWNEALHGVANNGVATVFPEPVGGAASWNPQLFHQQGTVIGIEGRAKHNDYAATHNGDSKWWAGMTFWTPNVNIFRDPRWGRGQETYGEDPYLTSEIGIEFVKGIQGDDPSYMLAMACAKHYAVHSGPEADRHRFDAKISDRDLYDTYLPQFERVVREGHVAGVMSAYNAVDGVPCSASILLLTDLLRTKWGFEGYVVSDCGAIRDIWGNRQHHYVDSAEAAAAAAIKAGCNLCCGSDYDALARAVQNGLVTEKDIDKALHYTLWTRFRLGLFDPADKVPYSKYSIKDNDTPEHRQVALELARQSLVLLKNDGILPLDRAKYKKIAVIGPNSDSKSMLLGNYHGSASRPISILSGIKQLAGPGIEVTYDLGTLVTTDRRTAPYSGQDNAPNRPVEELNAEALKNAKDANLIIYVGGITAGQEGEGFDRSAIELPDVQEIFIQTLYATGKPMIMVNCSGSAVALTWEDEHLPALLQAWYPGGEGGRAVAEVLFGEVNPSGHLPVTFYRATSDLPEFNDYSMTNRTYRYFDGKPLYAFGHGLSYTNFEYAGGKLNASRVTPDGNVQITFKIRNTGKRAGDDVAQLYYRHVNSQAPQPKLSLCGFHRVSLKGGESTDVSFEIPAMRLRYWSEEQKQYKIEAGDYEFLVGAASDDIRLKLPLTIVAQ